MTTNTFEGGTNEPAEIIEHFDFDHLPEGPMRDTSALFNVLANQIDAALNPGPEKSVALRKLLEAKDAAVRQARLDTKHALTRPDDPATPYYDGRDDEGRFAPETP